LFLASPYLCKIQRILVLADILIKAHHNNAQSIFISYSWKDISTVRCLVDELQAHGCSPWVDYLYLDLRQDITCQLSFAIARAKMFILVDTSHSRNSAWVKFEINHAIRVIPSDRLLTVSLTNCTTRASRVLRLTTDRLYNPGKNMPVAR
jgi:hypothetical protein